jgi:hypothetical protein
MTTQPLGPNVRKLIAYKTALLILPPGTPEPLAQARRGLAHLADYRREAEAWVREALAVLTRAPDHPYGEDEEVLAGVLLQRIAERKRHATLQY